MIEQILKFYGVPINEHPLSKLIGLHCSLTHSDISEFLNLINCPNDGRCLQYMHPISEYLIASYYEENHLRTPTAVTEAQNLIWESVEVLSVTNETLTKRSMPTKSNNPIYTFHFEVCPSTPSNPEFKAPNERAYKTLGAYLHQRMNHWFNTIFQEKSNINIRQYKSHLGLAARKSVRGYSDHTSKSGFHFSRLQRALLPVRLSKRMTSIGTELVGKGDNSYLKDLFIRNHRRQSKKETNKRKFKKRTKRWLTAPFPPVASVLEHNNQTSFSGPFSLNNESVNDDATIVSFYADSPDSEDTEDTVKTTITHPPEWTQTGWEQKRRTIGIIENRVQTNNIQPWSNRCASLNGLKLINRTLLFNKNLNPKIRLMIQMLLFTGISRVSLMNMGYMKLPTTIDDKHIDMEAIASDTLWFDIDLGIIWWISTGTSDKNGFYYFVDDFHQVKLPNFICDTIREIPDNQKLFNKKDYTNTQKTLSKLGLDGSKNISVSSLSLTFRGYFINGAGLPAIYADHIVGRKSSLLFSQHSYVTVPQNYLVNEWQRMCNALLIGISSSEPVESILSKMRFKPLNVDNIEEVESYRCIGSALTPRISKVRQHLAGLYEFFPHSSKELLLSNDEAWNYYMAYLYTFYALCTGQRPNHRPMPLLKQINTNTKTIHISDKNNKFYKEYREIGINPSLVKMLTTHHAISNKWICKKRLQGYSLEGNINSFLIADSEQKKLLQISPNKLDRLLLNQPPSYFSGLTNGCRHLLLTILNWNNTPQEYIDFISGHRHIGFEPSHICSPIASKQLGNNLSEFIETKVMQLFELKQPIEELKD